MLESLNHAQVVCFTQNYSFRGVIWTGRRRLSDALNDGTSDYVELSGVEVYKVHDPARRVHQVPELYLRKSSLALVAILAEVNADRPTNRLYGFVQKQRHEAVIFLPNYEISGMLHLTAKYQVKGPLAAEGESFIAVTNATAVATLNPRARVQAETILVRQNFIDAFYVSQEEVQTP